MATVKKTFRDLVRMNVEYHSMLENDPRIENTKFGYAWNRFYRKNIEKTFNEYNALLNDIRIDNALTKKETGEILFDPTPRGRGYKFSPEGLKAVVAKEREIEAEWNDKEYEVEPFITTEGPILTEIQLDIFEGTIVPCRKQ